MVSFDNDNRDGLECALPFLLELDTLEGTPDGAYLDMYGLTKLSLTYTISVLEYAGWELRS